MSKASETKQFRSFGLLVGAVFGIIGLWPVLFRDEDLRLWALLLAGLLVIPALVLPRGLGPVYRAWMAVGHALGWINTRIILGVVFYALFTPMGVIIRLFRQDPLHREFDPGADSYCVTRQRRPASHMKQQF